jgi:hypothetical protein
MGENCLLFADKQAAVKHACNSDVQVASHSRSVMLHVRDLHHYSVLLLLSA